MESVSQDSRADTAHVLDEFRRDDQETAGAVSTPVSTPGVPKLELASVSLEFDGKKRRTLGLDDVSFGIGEASVTCLIGPSGCGKTTVLRLVAGFIRPTSGTITIGGRQVNRPGPDRVMVFQSPVLYPWLTVRRNAAFGLSRDSSVTPEEISATLAEVGLADFEEHYPYQLSGGMRQRAQLARALLLKPEILLLDEPFGALDAQTRYLMQQMLQRLCMRHHPTVLMVTHDVEEALLLADTIIVLSSGPGHVVARYDITFPRPRGLATVGNPEFAATRREIVELIGTNSDPS